MFRGPLLSGDPLQVLNYNELYHLFIGEVILVWITPPPYFIRRYLMDNWTFGITMIVVGMGGTLLTLWILSLLMSVLKKAFPLKKEGEGK
jgi:hypothetical protein